ECDRSELPAGGHVDHDICTTRFVGYEQPSRVFIVRNPIGKLNAADSLNDLESPIIHSRNLMSASGRYVHHVPGWNGQNTSCTRYSGDSPGDTAAVCRKDQRLARVHVVHVQLVSDRIEALIIEPVGRSRKRQFRDEAEAGT